MGYMRIARKMTAVAAALAIMMTVPAAVVPSYTVYAEETQATEATTTKETTRETTRETKATSKTSETAKAAESQRTAETEKPAETVKPAETTKATEASKPSETVKETDAVKPTESAKESEPSETTRPSEPSETTESKETEPSETKAPDETTDPSETGSGEGESEPSETTEIPIETERPVTAVKKAARGAYNGIKVDGSFSDWDSVVKHDFTVGANSSVNEGAIVWDGDWIYIYLDEQQANSATWSGPERSGYFAITTDTGRTLTIHLTNNGASGNKVSVENKSTGKTYTSDNGSVKVGFSSSYSTWGAPTLTEIAIPTAALPDYKSKISFGFYQDDPIISNVANLHPVQNPDDPGNPGGPDNDGSKIKIDGDYRDWKNFPHQIIHYDKSGPNHNFPDSEGAIYQKDSKTVYVHAQTADFKLDYYDGNQFLEIRLQLGGKSTTVMGCLIDDKGNILDWTSSDKHFAPGTYRFALMDTRSWRTTTNINNIGEGDHFYGIQYVTVGSTIDETEFNIDTEALARFLGVSGGELKVYFHRVGKDPLIASGVSSGPVFTIALSTVAAGSYYVFTRRKRRQA